MTDPLQDPGVQGLAQLGRNALARVAELERKLAAVVAERDHLRARLAAIDNAPTVAVVDSDIPSSTLFVRPWGAGNKLPPYGTELIARPAKE